MTPEADPEIWKKPACFLRKFSPDGHHLIAFAADQTSLEIYEFCPMTPEANPEIWWALDLVTGELPGVLPVRLGNNMIRTSLALIKELEIAIVIYSLCVYKHLQYI